MSKPFKGLFAFPFEVDASDGHYSCPGMTLRDYFAAKAMQGICASKPSDFWTDDRIARDSYSLADEMLKAREQ